MSCVSLPVESSVERLDLVWLGAARTLRTGLSADLTRNDRIYLAL
jgi:hypothetical protein